MKSTSTTAARATSMMAAVMMGTALAASPCAATTASPNPRAIQDISKYCQACWRNARLPADSWQDCTQEVLVRLLERVEAEQWTTVLTDEESMARREFIRAIDAAKKRTQRARKFAGLSPDLAETSSRNDAGNRDDWATVELAAAEVLSPRQRRILELVIQGWTIPEIATELNTTAERISDDKYKAIKKLQHYFD